MEKNGLEKQKNNRDGKIKFEGEYLNGERHGKGKEYYLDGKIRFDGEYLNGETRKGKKYDYYDISELEYINEYLKGRHHGKVIGYDCCNGELFFESEYLNLNGKKLGKRKRKRYDYYNIAEYEGEYLNGKKHGRVDGYIYFINKLEFKDKDYFIWKRHRKQNVYDYCKNKLEFEGEFLNGKIWKGYLKNIMIIN